ncbi:MAG: hypothetical protein GF390_04075 [Candidatus Pacebacteria bacterium]|nr:hypothetical protein [Candidatus Paceibacterota bacterium]
MKYLLVEKNYYYRNWLVLLFITGVLWFLEFLGLITPVKAIGAQVLNPWQQFNVKVVRQAVEPVQQLQIAFKAARKVQDLERRLAVAQAQLGELDVLKAENAALKAMLENHDRRLVDSVITSPIISFANPAVAAGSQQGVRVGQMVIKEDTLLGVITKADLNQAQLVLLWQQDAPKILAKTQQGAKGLVQGDGRQVILTEVPVEFSLTVGDRVVSLGQPGIERDVFIGTVREIKSPPSAAVKTAVLEQYISFYDSVVVEVR